MGIRNWFRAAVLAALIIGGNGSAIAQTPVERIDQALQNITSLVRVGRIGYATIWDGNKYVQCHRQPDRAMRCEAAAPTLQPSLKRVLTLERQNQLAALGWVLDPSFGNYARSFAPDTATATIAEQILRTLTDGYGANLADLELNTNWVPNLPCPPRNGPSQNLAGIVNDAPQMRATALHGCSYVPRADTPQLANTAAELIAHDGGSTTAEIQRLRVNSAHRVHVVFETGIGYIQCMPETPPVAIYCEAQSAESWAALAAVLTPERIARLRAAGYADPGRSPNYAKSYPLDGFSDAAIAGEILTLLFDVYGYRGAAKLNVLTE
ncbi:MAG: hypothetical protein HXX15_21310 [Rhodopseudomonas sp.]|uniref:TY-Chap domain-containing protein n=1 Tax=Rhodopseudomonas sp. TaxID=1078 RepID=UPI001809F102|nr:hypothetical protein [Rhodopseudomonas sp.]NVN88626.1 hypothetical protein [Rhodopseudomonas sp.]